jgi:nicotinate-nucleotide pyrophosphorylase (carboxylating)
MAMNDSCFAALLELAIAEDLGESGDVTSKAIFDPDDKAQAVLVSKDSGVLCGCETFQAVFSRIDPALRVVLSKNDGDTLAPGDRIAIVSGSTVSILQGERIAINFIGFLSGIATQAAAFSQSAARRGRTLILDTRKTLPGYRSLSKYAVRTGGGKNHRMGLYDMVLIKDNHIDAAGSIAKAVEKVRKAHGSRFAIEVECRGLEDVREALDLGVQWIMLDNMDEESCADALRIRQDRGNSDVKFEASGNMSLERISSYSALGVDYISVGALTHSVKTFDFSLKIERKGIPR